MQIYVNYMHVFLFLIITDKIWDLLELSNCFDIVVETFNISDYKWRNFLIFLMYFLVFLCFCDFCILLFFIWNCLSIEYQYSSDFNCNESKYRILELKMKFWHKKPFSICFVHKSRKFSNFKPTFDYIMLRNFGTVRPIFPKITPKVAQNFKEKSHESTRREGRIPPPPPGPVRVKQKGHILQR